MTTVISKRNQLAEQEMQKSLKRLSGDNLNQRDIVMYAERAVAEIDWNNSALMHKGISWIAKNYLRKIGCQFS